MISCKNKAAPMSANMVLKFTKIADSAAPMCFIHKLYSVCPMEVAKMADIKNTSHMNGLNDKNAP